MTAPRWATAAELHALFGVLPGTLRQWVRREHVRTCGRGRYVVADVLARLTRTTT